MSKKINLWPAALVLLLTWCPPLAAEPQMGPSAAEERSGRRLSSGNGLISSPTLMQTFGPFTLEVPSGWATDYEEGCLTMLAEAPQSMLMVCSLPLEGQPFGEAVLEMAEVFDSVPRRDGDGDYSFQFANEQTGLIVHAVVTEEDGSIKLVGLAGEHPDLEKILGSLQEK